MGERDRLGRRRFVVGELAARLVAAALLGVDPRRQQRWTEDGVRWAQQVGLTNAEARAAGRLAAALLHGIEVEARLAEHGRAAETRAVAERLKAVLARWQRPLPERSVTDL